MLLGFASGNKHKADELSAILGYKLTMIESFEVEENGATFLDNALLKAKAFYAQTKMAVIADDSGLIVKALPHELGVKTARFGGPGLTQNERNNLLMQKMNGVTDREAKFICCLVLYIDDDNYFTVQKSWEGAIALEENGAGGFGYDPLFYLPSLGITASQLTDDEKNRLSHRAKAAKIMSNIITLEAPFFKASINQNKIIT